MTALATLTRPSLALDTLETPIRIAGLDGRVALGRLFLRTLGDRCGHLETVGARLADPDAAFLPVRIDDRVELIHLAWVAYLALAEPPAEVAELEEVGATRTAAELDLAQGESVRGDLLYVLPEGRRRVSDLLNAPGERFLLLVTADETLYVNRNAITRVRTR